MAVADITISAAPNPLEQPEAYFRLKLGGVDLPGVIPPGGVSGWAIESNYDVKKGKGSDGATITDTGDPPPKGSVKTQLWRTGYGGDPNDFTDWTAFVVMLRAARKAKKALDVVHPIINACEVSSVVVTKIGQLTDEGGGLYTVELELLKWVPQPKAAGGTPSSSQDKDKNKPDASSQKEPDPNADLKKEFADKAKEAQQPDD